MRNVSALCGQNSEFIHTDHHFGLKVDSRGVMCLCDDMEGVLLSIRPCGLDVYLNRQNSSSSILIM
jgi:hypothetical protein